METPINLREVDRRSRTDTKQPISIDCAADSLQTSNYLDCQDIDSLDGDDEVDMKYLQTDEHDNHQVEQKVMLTASVSQASVTLMDALKSELFSKTLLISELQKTISLQDQKNLQK